MKILVCTDGSQISNKAVKMAADIKETVRDAEITLIHVQQPIYIPAPFGVGYVSPVVVPDHLDGQIEEESQNILNDAADIFKAKNIEVNTVLTKGHPAATISEYASAENFDLIIIGSRGRSGLEKLILGSVSSAVVQEAKLNVLVVK